MAKMGKTHRVHAIFTHTKFGNELGPGYHSRLEKQIICLRQWEELLGLP